MALKNTAIPSIFTNCPKYLTDRTQKPKRVSRNDKDETMLREAFRMSRIDDKTTVVKFQLNSFAELLTKLDLLELKMVGLPTIQEQILYIS